MGYEETCQHGRPLTCECDACDFELCVDWIAEHARIGDYETALALIPVALEMPGAKWRSASGGPMAELVRLQTIVSTIETIETMTLVKPTPREVAEKARRSYQIGQG